MERTTISRSKMINLVIEAKKYIETVGVNNDKVAAACDNTISFEPNEKVIQEHDNMVKSLEKTLKRGARDLATENALMYLEGDKKGTFILSEKGEKLFTAEGQKALDKGLDILSDKYEEDIKNLMAQEVEFYISKVSDVPELPIEFKKSLALLLP